MSRTIRTTHLRDEPDVVDSGNGASTIVFAAGKGDLELARQIVEVRMTQQVARNAQRVRSHVKCFSRTNAGNRASGHIAHGVAASFAGGQPAIRKQTHSRRHIFELYEMKLDVFACREMTAAR